MHEIKWCEEANISDASGVGLGTGLLKVRENLNCKYDKIQDSAMLWAIIFASKSLFSMEQW